MSADVKEYRKIALIEAVQLAGENRDDVIDWIRSGGYEAEATERGIAIKTVEGPIEYVFSYWIARNEPGEFYGIDDDRFGATYVEVSE